MKKQSITLATVLLSLGGFVLPTVAKADTPIVGLWDVNYTSDYAGPLFHTFDQWHSDGLEFEVNNVAPGAMCQGTYKLTSQRGVDLAHVGFVFLPDGSLQGPFKETQHLMVSLDGQSYDGTYDTKYYDPDGNLLFEDTGTLHATRISVN